MGSPVSILVGNMVMEDVEERALSTFPTPPRLWKRYVDNVLTVLPSDMLDIFLLHLNSVESSIQFTYEVENSKGILPFLDISLKHKTDGSICMRVFRKKTHTDRYLDFSSHQPITHKMAVIRTLSSKAEAICSTSVSTQDELTHISTALSKNNYPKHLIQRQLCQRPPNTASKDQEYTSTVVLPYLKCVSAAIRQVLLEVDIRIVYQPHTTLKQLLVHPKDPIDL